LLPGGSFSLVNNPTPQPPAVWVPANVAAITDQRKKDLVRYGQELIAHTAKYLGPHGTVSQHSNGMNCQNCHLQAGTVPFGNNYGSVASLYPKFRARSGKIETIQKRINDCIERSLNGKALGTSSHELQAMTAYIAFIGSNVPKGVKAVGSGLKELPYLTRAADPQRGRIVYQAHCATCHQPHGDGLLASTQDEYVYPPLWGNRSYNNGAGLFRISNFARFAKSNMPLGVTYKNPTLTDEQAWDVAAFINTQARPTFDAHNDWPDKRSKPVDYPFGPYADRFSETTHKYGPFTPIVNAQNSRAANAK